MGDNIKIYFNESGYPGMDCIDVAQDRRKWRAIVSMVMKLRVPSFRGSC